METLKTAGLAHMQVVSEATTTALRCDRDDAGAGGRFTPAVWIALTRGVGQVVVTYVIPNAETPGELPLLAGSVAE